MLYDFLNCYWIFNNQSNQYIGIDDTMQWKKYKDYFLKEYSVLLWSDPTNTAQRGGAQQQVNTVDCRTVSPAGRWAGFAAALPAD